MSDTEKITLQLEAPKKRNLVPILVFVATLLLGGAAIYTANRIQRLKTTQPEESGASGPVCEPYPLRDGKGCWEFNSTKSLDGCNTYQKCADSGKVCARKIVFDEDCNQHECWFCAVEDQDPDCPDGSVSDKAVCERNCSCEGFDVNDCFKDECTDEGSSGCWYCQKRRNSAGEEYCQGCCVFRDCNDSNQCVEVRTADPIGSEADRCDESGDCSYYDCVGENCQQLSERPPKSQAGKDGCDPNDANACKQPTHLACNASNQCVATPGAGTDGCDPTDDHPCEHKACTAQKTCDWVDGVGGPACQSNEECNQNPVCQLLGANPTTITAGEGVTFTITGYDPDGSIDRYKINPGDGSTATVRTSPTIVVTYSVVGRFTAKAYVRDDNLVWSPAVAACQVTITVETPTYSYRACDYGHLTCVEYFTTDPNRPDLCESNGDCYYYDCGSDYVCNQYAENPPKSHPLDNCNSTDIHTCQHKECNFSNYTCAWTGGRGDNICETSEECQPEPDNQPPTCLDLSTWPEVGGGVTAGTPINFIVSAGDKDGQVTEFVFKIINAATSTVIETVDCLGHKFIRTVPDWGVNSECSEIFDRGIDDQGYHRFSLTLSNYVFENPGSYKVQVLVKDNDNAWCIL